ncbi:MAG TPA: CRISPR-associated helicase Cas3' [Ktedonobacterales bacterium]|nr:CRISPR-associated helicase Cas3' [Ktedonobacterales bacterium]
MTAFAHSKNASGQRQILIDHLRQVAEQATQFAAPLGAAELAFIAGILHDIGKFHPDFQHYLLAAEANPTQRHHGPDHKGGGAVLATSMQLDSLAFLVAGHHGGLPAWSELTVWLRERAANPAVQQAIQLAQGAMVELQTRSAPHLPEHLKQALEAELFVRLLFSALVDADFLDTEQHFQGHQAALRSAAPNLTTLWEAFSASQQQLSGQRADRVNTIRHEVYLHCQEAATLPPGFFRLTVPTGGGKTRSSLAFALLHALKYGLRRVIYAIPYTSIIEQTVDVFRDIFPDEKAVLEHHSALALKEPASTPSLAEQWARLAAENWDAPLIVTTTIQFFESLLACTPSACRKLHNIAQSVIILDEVQMLPTHVLEPILDVLRQLVSRYGVTVVLCTATQPALDHHAAFSALEHIREIIPQPERLFAELKRVEYHWPQQGECWTWEQVAQAIQASQQALTIVNTRADALALVDALGSDPAVLHLSTRMCGAHRRAVLQKVRQRLNDEKPCWLVSTQLIEAGVDVDFPLVLRAMGPLDRIAQAAGRCNREGRRPSGEVIVFAPAAGRLPAGPYRTATEVTQGLLRGGTLDLHDPALYEAYFARYYRQVDRDEPHIQEARRRLDYPAVAERFHLIGDDTTSVIVHYDAPDSPGAVAHLLHTLQSQPAHARECLRRLQPYIVGLRPHELTQAQKRGLATEVIPGLWEWCGNYDHLRGIMLDSAYEPDHLIW